MIDWSDVSYRVVLRPDRRQTTDRRQVIRGGRRASDRAAFAVSSGIAAYDERVPVGLREDGSAVASRILH